MPRKSSILKAKELILTNPVYNNKRFFLYANDIWDLFEKARYEYGVSIHFSFSKFVSELIRYNILDRVIKLEKKPYTTPNYSKKRTIFIKPGYDNLTLTVALASSNNSYLAYFSAMSIHELSLQIPKNIYVVKERSKRYNTNSISSQEAIDKAFSKRLNTKSQWFEFGESRIYEISGYYTDRLGVIQKNGIFYTDLERTLIDIIVRPHYSGGIFSILDAYKEAKNKLDVKKMLEYYNQLNFTYPYNQSIGFILEKADYKDDEINLFYSEKWSWKFYLTYNMNNMNFSEKWHLYYPSGF